MAFYESVFIVRQDTPHQRVEELTNTFSEIISSGGGKVANTEFWGLRSLAYKIKKNKKGHYVLMNIDSPSNALQDMERAMQLNEDIIRYMSIKVDQLEKNPSPILQGRSERTNEKNNFSENNSNQTSNIEGANPNGEI
tara:strand:- start:288 stop:701 length:414 start_codon:yes stop_codon:yes gene_type:complete